MTLLQTVLSKCIKACYLRIWTHSWRTN